jgi:hypothetical protein
MMRTLNEKNTGEIEELHAEDWQLELLKLNPEYVFWGPHEDYMWKLNDKEAQSAGKKYGCGWESRIIVFNWREFKNGNWELDEYNECVNFYFSVKRSSKNCPICGGNGYHPDAQWVSESFYDFTSPFSNKSISAESANELFGISIRKDIHPSGSYPNEETFSKYNNEFREFCEAMRRGDGRWNWKITQEELDLLWEEGRLGNHGKNKEHRKPTLEEVRAAQMLLAVPFRQSYPEVSYTFLLHDAINVSILVRARCKRFGIPVKCNECKGKGQVYTSNKAHAFLTLWWIHPRKGASRGIEISLIEKNELNEIFAFLRKAAERNANRFNKIPEKWLLV